MHHSWQAVAIAKLGRARRGAAAVEFALTAPLLLALLAPLADLGMAYSQQLQVQQTAQAGAQYATLHPWNSNSVQSITNAANAASALTGLSVPPPPQQICGCPNGAAAIRSVTCNSICPDGTTAGYYVIVNAQLPYRTRMPFSFLGRSVTLTARSTVRIQ
jgi:Flp pilus assembly protein TadG